MTKWDVFWDSVKYFYAVANSGVLYLIGEFVDITVVHFVLFLPLNIVCCVR